MPTGGTLTLFSLAALALIVVPGPAVLYVVAQSIDGGRLAGVVSALGIGVGGLVHVAAATVGVSAVLVSSATAFTVVKLAGAAYLVAIGLRTLFARREPPGAAAGPERRPAGASHRASSSTSSIRRPRSSSSRSCRSSPIPPGARWRRSCSCSG